MSSNLSYPINHQVKKLMKQANLCLKDNKFQEAITACHKIMKLQPNLVDAYLIMGNALQMLRNFEEAIASYSQALKIQPDLAAAIANLGSVYLKQGKFEDAKNSCQKAIDIEPDFAIAYWNLGHALNEQNKLEKALPYWQKALELKPDLVGPEFHLDLGHVLRERGKLDEAIASYQKALKLKLNDHKIYQNLGDILGQQEKLDEAINYYIQALKIKPNSKETYISLGHTLRKKGSLDKANTCFTVCLPTNVLVEFDRTNANWSINSTLDHPLVEIINLSQKLQKDSYLSSAKTPDENVHPNLRETEIKCPETFVAIISNGRAWGDFFTSAIITPDGQVLKEISTGSFALIASSDRLPTVSYIDGTVAFLSVRGVESYYHWILDLVSRFELIRAAEISLDNIDKFVVNSCVENFQKETLILLGIPEEKIIESSNLPHIQAKNLIVPSLPGSGRIPKFVCDFLRKEFLKYANFEQEKRAKRLYISRKLAVSRRIINEDELVNFLREYGFDTVIFESMSFREQISFMAAAEVVIAPHGAGLTNLVFSSPGTKIVEIFNNNYVNGCFWVIANQIGLEYYYLTGEKSNIPQEYSVAEDILVNINALSEILKFANIDKKSSDFNETIFSENFRLRNINLIVFPDWSQAEESLYEDLARVLRAIANNPDSKKMKLLIDTENIAEEDANLIISGVIMNLLMEDELDLDESQIYLIPNFSERQWQYLLTEIDYRIVLQHDNQEMVAKKGFNLPPMLIDMTNNTLELKIDENLLNARKYRQQIFELVKNNPHQLTIQEYSYITEVVGRKKTSNFLIFGVGNDSNLWREINHNGTTIFIEDNQNWLSKVQENCPEIEAYLVQYQTNRKDWLDLLEKNSRGANCLSMEVPDRILQTKWDFIFVDAPAGYADETPGRMKSIYTAAKLALETGNTDVFVHDCDRQVEAIYSGYFLGDKNLVIQLGKLRHYKIINSK